MFQVLAKTKRDPAVEVYKEAIPIITLYDPGYIPVSDDISDYLGEDEVSEIVELVRKATQYSPYVDLESLFQSYSTKWNKSLFEKNFIIPNACPYTAGECVDFINVNLELLISLAKDANKSDAFFYLWELFEKQYLGSLLPRMIPVICSESPSISLKVCPSSVLQALLNFMDYVMVPNDDLSESSNWSQPRHKMWKNERTREVFLEIIRQCLLLPLTEYTIIVKAVDIVNRILFSVISCV